MLYSRQTYNSGARFNAVLASSKSQFDDTLLRPVFHRMVRLFNLHRCCVYGNFSLSFWVMSPNHYSFCFVLLVWKFGT